MMSNDDVTKLAKSKTLDHFSSEYTTHGADVKSLSWGSNKSQGERFKLLIKVEQPIAPPSILDVGCGFGDLCQFLNNSNYQFSSYTGIDVMPEFIQEAKQRFQNTENAAFINTDIFDLSPDKKFDIVYESGIFNLEFDDWYNVVSSTLKKMFLHTNYALIFNMQSILGNSFVKRLPKTGILDPIWWLQWSIHELSRYVTLHHEYMEADFTLIVYKNKLQRFVPNE